MQSNASNKITKTHICSFMRIKRKFQSLFPAQETLQVIKYANFLGLLSLEMPSYDVALKLVFTVDYKTPELNGKKSSKFNELILFCIFFSFLYYFNFSLKPSSCL